MGQRSLLQIMKLVDQRIMMMLSNASLEQMEQNLSVLRVILVPGIMHCFAGAGHNQRCDKNQVEAFCLEELARGRW